MSSKKEEIWLGTLHCITLFQTQPCNWREHATTTVKRKKRSIGNITAVDDEDLGDYEYADDDNVPDNSNKSFSESLRLFQSIQVLANEEDRAALKNTTTESKINNFLEDIH